MTNTDVERTQQQGIEQQEQAKIKYADLPLISVLKKTSMQEAKLLLEELESVEETLELAEQRSAEIKKELEQIQMKAKLPGMRFGELCFVARINKGRETLDKALLIEAGVRPSVIAQCMKVGKEYVTRTFKRIDV